MSYSSFVRTRAKAQRKYTLKVKYGIDIKEFDTILKYQGNKCLICGTSGIGTKWHVDHNHKTNKVRGILCINCNTGLGQFKDSINILKSAIKYLRKHK